MCGLYGFSGNNPDIRKLTILGLHNLRRGLDSSGIYYETDKKFVHIREAKPADELWAENILKKSYSEFKPVTCVIAHNRQKSVGVVKKENAHPFLFEANDQNKGNIVLAHNGTLKYYHDLCIKYPKIGKSTNIDVDSMIFALYFANYDDTEILKHYDGAAALSWKNTNDHKLYLWSDGERPLHYGKSKEGIYYSSEDISLKLIGCSNITELEKRKIYTFQFGELINVSDTIEQVKKTVTTTQSYNENFTRGIVGTKREEKQKKEIVDKVNRYLKGNAGVSLPVVLSDLQEIDLFKYVNNKLTVEYNSGLNFIIDLDKFYKGNESFNAVESKSVYYLPKNNSLYLHVKFGYLEDKKIEITVALEYPLDFDSLPMTTIDSFLKSQETTVSKSSLIIRGKNNDYEICNFCDGVGIMCNYCMGTGFTKKDEEDSDDEESDFDITNSLKKKLMDEIANVLIIYDKIAKASGGVLTEELLQEIVESKISLQSLHESLVENG